MCLARPHYPQENRESSIFSMEENFDIRNPDKLQGHARRRLLRIAVPIAFVALMIAAILGIAFFSYSSNRKDALALSDDLLSSLERRIATEVRAFLTPAADAVEISHNVLNQTKYPFFADGWQALAEPLAMQVLKTLPQVATFSFADNTGNFLMLKKMANGSIHSKHIETGGDKRRVTWIRRDPEGNEIVREEDPQDTYDPRSRPWYIGAAGERGIYWTDVYVFFTDRAPGITASMAFRSVDGRLLGAVGVDVSLASLSAFLANLKIGRHGQAMIIGERGYIVAFPELSRMLAERGGELVPRRLDELNDPVLVRAFNRFQVEGQGSRELSVNGRKYINTVSSLKPMVGRNWSTLILVPADDFVGFVSRNNRKSLWMSLGVLVLASVLAGLLIWQGLRSDRISALLLARRREMEAHSGAFSELASRSDLFDPAETEPLEHMGRIVAEAAGVRRVSVWQLQFGHRQLVCRECFDRESGGHTSGTLLRQEDLPHLFDAILAGETMAIGTAAEDLRSVELHRVYLGSMGCASLLSVPIASPEKPLGALWFEDEAPGRQWPTEEQSFARAVAGLLALRFCGTRIGDNSAAQVETDDLGSEQLRPDEAGTDRHSTHPGQGDDFRPVKPATHMRRAAIIDRRTQRFRQELEKYAGASESPGVDIFEDTTIMVLQLTDSTALAERLEDPERTIAGDRLIQRLESKASSTGIEYVKLMGNQVVCAAGFGDDASDHPYLIAELALSIREICSGIFPTADRRLAFRMGIDTGGVLGQTMGNSKQNYNLWGDALATADIMAATGPSGEIQVSECAYRRLQSHYLFKKRGCFYLPNVGELDTFILIGRV